MYQQVWQRYLPVIRIVMKRALSSGDQVLPLNAPDFERIGLTRKSGYKFEIGLANGKLRNVIVDVPLASALAQVLLEDATVQSLIQEREFVISLSPRYELSIRHIAHTTVPNEGE
ncbi:hypothetical protein [Flaviaesturariibacter amylovorans]|uniref:Uncharacterized protein n=1 Tax=Flaviaesturariibacter amylovorans TaxID=1084520 RepID=A0ABP8H7Y3_9BACT